MLNPWEDPGLYPPSQYCESYRKWAYDEPTTWHKLSGGSNLEMVHNTESIHAVMRERWMKEMTSEKIKAADY